MPSTRSSRLFSSLRAVAPAAGLLVLLAGVISPAVVAQQADRPAEAPATTVTFAKDVAPILQKNCQQCHQPGAIGPMPLTTYEEVRPWARAIKTEGGRGRDAAVSLRPRRRHPEAEGRSPAERGRDPDDCALGGHRGAAGQPGRPAAAGDVPGSRTSGRSRRSSGRPISIIRTKPFTLPAKGQDVWWRPSRADRPDHGSVHQGGLGQAVGEGTRRGAPRQQRADGLRREDGSVGREASGSRNTRSARSAKSCRRMPAATLPANSMVRWDVHYYPTGEELEGRRDRDGRLALSGGPSGEVQAGSEALLAADEGRRARDAAATARR